MYDDDPERRPNTPNRAILLTPAGAAAIAVVRLVGAGVRGFLARHFSREPVTGRAVQGELRDGDRVIDDPVVVLVDAERAIADVNLHGGAWVVRAFVELARRAEFEVVDLAQPPLDPDAFAIEAGSMLEREVLTHLPLARTELAIRALLAQPAAWSFLQRTGAAVREQLDVILADRALHHLLHLPRVAIVGAANAGKSTLANQLFAQERSITADLPGTTRDWVGEIANLDGLAVMLVDTPGVRQTADSIEAAALAHSARVIERADQVVLVLDATRPLQPEQSALLARFPDAIHMINKVDRSAAWSSADHPAWLRTVATTGAGVDELRRAIRRRFGCETLVIDRPRCWTRRQREILERAKSNPHQLAQLW